MRQEQNGIQYYNSGGWVDSIPTYITIDEEGVQIHEYQPLDVRDSGEERGDSMLDDFADSETSVDAEYENIGSGRLEL